MSAASNPIATGWLNENSLREYPFHEGCGRRPADSSGVPVEGGWSIPNCLLVDMCVTSSFSNVWPPCLYLGQMSVVGGSVTLSFFDVNGKLAMSAYATAEGHEVNASYQLSGTGYFNGARGMVCLGDLDRFFELTPEGLYTFPKEETLIEAACVRVSPVAVRSLRVVDTSGYTSLMLTGDVSLIAGENIRFDYRPDGNALVVSADPNSGYAEKCDCEVSETEFVRSINGIAIGDVQITGDDCVGVTTDNSVIRITNECAKPCCGCAETTFINQTINDLQTSVGTLSGNVSSLGGRLDAFVASYVLSRKTLQ